MWINDYQSGFNLSPLSQNRLDNNLIPIPNNYSVSWINFKPMFDTLILNDVNLILKM